MTKLNKWQLFGLFILALLAACAPMPLTSNTPQGEGTSVCGISDLTLTLEWNTTLPEMLGSVVFSNYTADSCTIPADLRVEILNESGQPLEVEYKVGVNTAVELQSGSFATIPFNWNNWCGSELSGIIQLVFSSPSQAESAALALDDPNGQPVSQPPFCQDFSLPSTFMLGTISLPE